MVMGHRLCQKWNGVWLDRNKGYWSKPNMGWLDFYSNRGNGDKEGVNLKT